MNAFELSSSVFMTCSCKLSNAVMGDSDDMIVQIEFKEHEAHLQKQEFSKKMDLKYIMELLNHSCTWKGGKDAPNHDTDTLRSICHLKKISCSKRENKFITFRKLISHLRKEMFTIDSNCVCPSPTTEAAKLLFKGELDTKIRVFTHQETGL